MMKSERQFTLANLILFVLLLGALGGWISDRYNYSQAYNAGKEAQRREDSIRAQELERQKEIARVINTGLELAVQYVQHEADRKK